MNDHRRCAGEQAESYRCDNAILEFAVEDGGMRHAEIKRRKGSAHACERPQYDPALVDNRQFKTKGDDGIVFRD